LLPFNMKNGEPLTQQTFSIYDFRNTAQKDKLLKRIESDSNGIAMYNPAINILEKHNMFDAFVLSSPRKSFIWGRKQDMFDMWDYKYNLNLNVNESIKYFYNHLLTFTDKHLYKAGQTVKFKGIIRQIVTGEMTIPEVMSVNGEVFNSRNESIHKFRISKNEVTELGSFAGRFELLQDAPTGFYRIHFDLMLKKGKYRKDLNFTVQEYKPAKYEVKVKLDQKQLISGQSLSGLVNGRYLFGTPMINAQGNCTWTISSAYFSPPGWQGYSFGAPDSGYRDTLFNKNFKLDEEGNFNFKRNSLTVPGKNSGRINVYGEISDKDNNRLTGSASMMVHRGEYYIGVKSKSYFFEQNKPGHLILLTVNPKGKLIKNSSVDMEVIREEWKY